MTIGTGKRNMGGLHHDFIKGAASVRAIGTAGTLETRTITFNAAADMPTDSTNSALVLAKLVTIDNIPSGTQRARLTFHGDSDIVTFARAVLAAINSPDDITSANRLTIVDVTGGGSASSDSKQRMISKSAPIIEYNLEGTGADISSITLVGVLTAGTGAVGTVNVSVELW